MLNSVYAYSFISTRLANYAYITSTYISVEKFTHHRSSRYRIADETLPGIVRAPLVTTVMQVSSRLLLVWPIVNTWPFLALSPFYASMLVAWSVTEVIRYSYFALSLAQMLPRALTWVRYTTFYVLYPLGITSECMLVYGATGPAGQKSGWIGEGVLYAILAIYVPGMASSPTLSVLVTIVIYIHG